VNRACSPRRREGRVLESHACCVVLASRYDCLEAEGFQYTIRLPPNQVLQASF